MKFNTLQIYKESIKKYSGFYDFIKKFITNINYQKILRILSAESVVWIQESSLPSNVKSIVLKQKKKQILALFDFDEFKIFCKYILSGKLYRKTGILVNKLIHLSKYAEYKLKNLENNTGLGIISVANKISEREAPILQENPNLGISRIYNSYPFAYTYFLMKIYYIYKCYRENLLSKEKEEKEEKGKKISEEVLKDEKFIINKKIIKKMYNDCKLTA